MNYEKMNYEKINYVKIRYINKIGIINKLMIK